MILVFISICICCILCAAIKLVYDKFALRKITLNIKFSDEYVHEGEESQICEIVSNDKAIPLPIFEIRFAIDKALQYVENENSSVSDFTNRRDTFCVSMYQRITRHFDIKCTKRGYYTIDNVHMMAKNIFITGMYIAERKLFTSMFVLPGRVYAGDVNIPFSRIMGTLLAKRRVYDDPFEFSGIREYSLGDPVKNINWKVSAKNENLMVNTFGTTMSQSVLFMIDMDGVSDRRIEILDEMGIRLVSALAVRLIKEGISISVVSNGTNAITGKDFEEYDINGVDSILTLQKKLACLKGGDKLKGMDELLKQKAAECDRDITILVSSKCNKEVADSLCRESKDLKPLWIAPYVDEHDEFIYNSGKIDFLWWKEREV